MEVLSTPIVHEKCCSIYLHVDFPWGVDSLRIKGSLSDILFNCYHIVSWGKCCHSIFHDDSNVE